METNQFKFTYEINNQIYTEEISVSEDLEQTEMRKEARKILRKKHPGVKYWEIRTVSIEKIK